jgi:hypothetical protein
MPEEPTSEKILLREIPPVYGAAADGDIDLSLLMDSLSKTPWERMQANDDAVNFAETLRGAMLKRHAKPK